MDRNAVVRWAAVAVVCAMSFAPTASAEKIPYGGGGRPPDQASAGKIPYGGVQGKAERAEGNARNAALQQPSKPTKKPLGATDASGQIDKPVVVRFLQRPLSVDRDGALQSITGGMASHVQIVAFDKTTNTIIDNFGLTGNFVKTEKAGVFKENIDDILRNYSQEPLGEIEMSSGTYYQVRDITIKQLEDAYYSPLNSLTLDDVVRAGMEGAKAGIDDCGPADDGTCGKVALAAAVDAIKTKYDEDGRHNQLIVEVDGEQMCFPGLNCQAAVEVFIRNGEGYPTWNVVKKYLQSGEMLEGCSLDTSKLEELLKKRIAIVELLIERGEQVSESEIAAINACSQDIMRELQRLSKELMAFPISDEEKMRMARQSFLKANVLAERVMSLDRKAESMKIASLQPISTVGAPAGEASSRAEDKNICNCASPSLSYSIVSESIPAAVKCAKCGHVVGVAVKGRIISKNPAVNGKALK